MATIISDSIICPLGFSTQDVYRAILSGKTALRTYESTKEIPFEYTASLFNDRQQMELTLDGYTPFESLAIHCINDALSKASVEINQRTVFVLSSTKGNVGLLKSADNPDNIISLGKAAKKIADAVNIPTEPIVVCNACISGVSALILANRLLKNGNYDNAIVCGVDVQNEFIISGFQSLKALSPYECKPFDIERLGLNLGEAAATIVMQREDRQGSWHLVNGAIRNDAHHITNPSPIGEGCHNAIEYVLDGISRESIAQINAHGTATMFNDQMESKAISRAGLSEVPTNALKGYLGHTMGASGIIETILTMHALDEGIVLGTRGYEEIGVGGKVKINSENSSTHKTDFLKIISGFGGCNGAILLSHNQTNTNNLSNGHFTVAHRVSIDSKSVCIDGKPIKTTEEGLKLITEIYKTKINDYPKYYKMDALAKLGFVATELLLQAEGKTRFADSSDRAIALFNSSASSNADLEYLHTISDKENYFPSPSVFVYTLPNIVTGEIAIRNKCHSETAFYILAEKNQDMIDKIVQSTFSDKGVNSIIAGWLEYKNENTFEADIYIVTK